MAARTADMIFDGIDGLVSAAAGWRCPAKWRCSGRTCVLYSPPALQPFVLLVPARSIPQADSPLEVAGLSLLAAAVISWSLDRHARAAALLSALHLRLLGVLLLHGAQQASGALDHLGAKAAAKARLLDGKHSDGKHSDGKHSDGSPGARRRLSLAPSSPGKDIASFRLPEASLAGVGPLKRRQQQASAGGQPQRWSMDAGAGGAGTQQRRHAVRTQPKPRTSLDFEPAPASPPRRVRHQRAHAASLAEHRAAPQLGGGSDGEQGGGAARPRQQHAGENRWQPRMQRIASGQELAVLAAGGGAGSARSSLDLGLAAQQPAAAAPPAAVAPASQPCDATLAALSNWLPSLALAWPPSPFSSVPPKAAAAGVDPSDPGAAPFSPSTAAAAVARHLAASGSAAAAWASSTVDTVLRPLIPGGTNARALDALLWRAPSTGDAGSDAAAGEPLHHASSAPLPGPSRRSSEHGSACSAADHRRQSLDGASTRHYTHGGLTADPNR